MNRFPLQRNFYYKYLKIAVFSRVLHLNSSNIYCNSGVQIMQRKII